MEMTKLVLDYIMAIKWPAVVLVGMLIFRKELRTIFSRLRKAELPGGISIETFPDKIKDAKALSTEVRKEKRQTNGKKEQPVIPLTEANTRMLNLGLSPSPSGLELSYYRTLATEDPNLALAGLRIEVEAMLKNLAKGFKVKIGQQDTAGIIARKLRERGAITSRQAELINSVVRLCNASVHGLKVTVEQADDILDIAAVLRDQYISWLSWGFPSG